MLRLRLKTIKKINIRFCVIPKELFQKIQKTLFRSLHMECYTSLSSSSTYDYEEIHSERQTGIRKNLATLCATIFGTWCQYVQKLANLKCLCMWSGEGCLVGDGGHGCQFWPQSGSDLSQLRQIKLSRSYFSTL